MYACISNDENCFLILDTDDGVVEWTTIQDCRTYLENNVQILGLSLVRFDSKHTYVDYNPVVNFVPKSIDDDVRVNSLSLEEYNNIIYIIRSYILSGNNIINLRNRSGSFINYKNNLLRWCYNGLQSNGISR